MKLRLALPLTLLAAALPLYAVNYGGKKTEKSSKEEEKAGGGQGWFDWRGPMLCAVPI